MSSISTCVRGGASGVDVGSGLGVDFGSSGICKGEALAIGDPVGAGEGIALGFCPQAESRTSVTSCRVCGIIFIVLHSIVL